MVYLIKDIQASTTTVIASNQSVASDNGFQLDNLNQSYHRTLKHVNISLSAMMAAQQSQSRPITCYYILFKQTHDTETFEWAMPPATSTYSQAPSVWKFFKNIPVGDVLEHGTIPLNTDVSGSAGQSLPVRTTICTDTSMHFRPQDKLNLFYYVVLGESADDIDDATVSFNATYEYIVARKK